MCVAISVVTTKWQHVSLDFSILGKKNFTNRSPYITPDYGIQGKSYTLSYPNGRSLDKNNQIQVDANSLLQGGVATDIIIPMTTATAIDTYTNGIDTALAYAENCLQTSCWAPQSSDESSGVWGVIAGVVAGVALTAGGIYLLKQRAKKHNVIRAAHVH